MASAKLKLVSAVSAVLFSLVTCFTGAFAWFNAQGNAKDNSDDFEIITDPNIVSFALSIYKYDYDDKAGYVKKETDEGFSFALNKYDKFLTERNTNNNNIIRLEVEFAATLPTDVDRKVNFDFECATTKINDPFNPGIEDTKTRKFADTAGYKYTSTGTDSTTKTYICNNISNVIYFKVLPYTYKIGTTTYKFNSSITIDETVPNNTYLNATAAFASLSESPFIAGGNKTTRISNNNVIVNSQATSMVVYIEYAYNKDLVESFLNPNEFIDDPETSALFTGGVNIEFLKDVLGIYISSEAKSK